jgi:hypothetical protein
MPRFSGRLALLSTNSDDASLEIEDAVSEEEEEEEEEEEAAGESSRQRGRHAAGTAVRLAALQPQRVESGQ